MDLQLPGQEVILEKIGPLSWLPGGGDIYIKAFDELSIDKILP